MQRRGHAGVLGGRKEGLPCRDRVREGAVDALLDDLTGGCVGAEKMWC